MTRLNRKIKESENEMRQLERIDQIFTILVAIMLGAAIAFAIISKLTGAW